LHINRHGNWRQALVGSLPGSEVVAKVEIAGAGFDQRVPYPLAKQVAVKAVLESAGQYGRGIQGSGRKVQRGIRFG